jgi:hypothetical protein
MAKLTIIPGTTHRELTANLLRVAHGGPVEMKQYVDENDRLLRQLGHVDEDLKERSYRELLLSGSMESSTLLQTEIAQTFIEGAEPFKQARNAVNTIPMKSNVMQINLGETGTYAEIVAPAAEIPIDTQDYTSVTFTARKRGVRPLITKELVADSLFDVVALEVSKAGARLENALNRSVVDELLGTCAATAALCTDFGNAGATPLKFIDTACTTIKNNGYLPNRVLFTPPAPLRTARPSVDCTSMASARRPSPRAASARSTASTSTRPASATTRRPTCGAGAPTDTWAAPSSTRTRASLSA